MIMISIIICSSSSSSSSSVIIHRAGGFCAETLAWKGPGPKEIHGRPGSKDMLV